MKIGITGGMGCGKTYVCNLLRKQGFPVYSCDERAKRLMKEDEAIKAAIVQVVGEDAYTEDGELNKPVLTAFLYSSKENQDKINAIVHPRIRSDFNMWCNFQDSDVMFMECAILYEAGLETAVDKVIYIYASDEVRMRRVIRRDKINRTEAYNRMQMQLPEEEKLKRADYCVLNNGSNNILKQLHNIEI